MHLESLFTTVFSRSLNLGLKYQIYHKALENAEHTDVYFERRDKIKNVGENVKRVFNKKNCNLKK